MLLHASSPRLRRVWSSASRQAAASRCLSAPYYLIPSLHSFLVVRSRAARDDRCQVFNCREPVVLRRHCDCDTITAAVTAKEE